MPKFRTIPETVEAVRFYDTEESLNEICDLGLKKRVVLHDGGRTRLHVAWDDFAHPGDYVVKSPSGTFYSCRADKFEERHIPADTPDRDTPMLARREIAQQPTKSVNGGIFGKGTTIWLCPKCGMFNTPAHCYCWKCGQALKYDLTRAGTVAGTSLREHWGAVEDGIVEKVDSFMEKAFLGDLNPAQKAFVKATERNILFGGHRGAGIGFGLRRKLTIMAIMYPGIKMAVFSKDSNKIREKIEQPLVKIGAAKKMSGWPHGIKFSNGSTITFIFGRKDQVLRGYAGQEYEVIAIIDAQENDENMVSLLRTINRTSRPGGQPMMIFHAHPGGDGCDWIKRLFVDRKFNEHENPDDYRYIRATELEDGSLFATKEPPIGLNCNDDIRT